MSDFFDTEPSVRLAEAIFVAVLTDVILAGDVRRYAWTEQAADPSTGTYSRANPARGGTVATNYATALNNSDLPLDRLYWIRLKHSTGQQQTYEVLDAAGGSSGAGYATTATDGGTTAFTAGAASRQFFTGTLNQTVQLPDVSTLTIGTVFYVTNHSTGTLTVTSSGGSTVAMVPPGVTMQFTSVSTTGTDSSTWSYSYTSTTAPPLTTYSTTATATGTTTLTLTSTSLQYFTGTLNQTIILPVVSTLTTGTTYQVINQSTGTLTIQSSGGNTIALVPPGVALSLICVLVTGTGTTSWSYDYVGTTALPRVGLTTTATAAGTTTFSLTSTYDQYFTGGTTQTVVMPVASTLYVGWDSRIVNQSSGTLTVQSSGGSTIGTVTAGTSALLTCTTASGTSASSWDLQGNAGGGATSPLTTKGDLWGYSTLDARVPIGADGDVLTADAAQTLGLKWSAPATWTAATPGFWSVTAVKTGTYTAAYGEFVLTDCTTGSFTVNLPTAASKSGVMIAVKRTDASLNTVTVDGAGAETIDAAATVGLSSSPSRVCLTIVSDGTNWRTLSAQ